MKRVTEYNHDAYDSTNIKRQVRTENQSFFHKLASTGEEIIPWTKPIRAISTSVYDGILPSQFEKIRNDIDRGDEQQILPTNLSFFGFEGNSWLKIFMLVAGMGRVMVLWGGGCTLAACLFVLSIGLASNSNMSMLVLDASKVFLTYLILVGLPGLIFWFYPLFHTSGRFQIKKIEDAMKLRKRFELNRETGMVTLFKNDGSIRYCRPFLEFDCILQTVPQNGVLLYQMLLKHRYSTTKYGVPISNLMTERDILMDYYRLWNMVQQFMDISQPLPDTYYFEEYREFDPTTKTYDEKEERNPRFWRDMTDKEYQDEISKIRKEQNRDNVLLGERINIFE